MTHDPLQSRLKAYFARHSPEQSRRSPGPLVTLAGGWASSLYTFTLDRAESGDAPATTLVLTLYAPDARGREHATREWRALTRLRSMNCSVPRAILCEPDAHHLGHPFIVMDHIPGTSFWHAFEAADSATQSQLTQSFVAQLHSTRSIHSSSIQPPSSRIRTATSNRSLSSFAATARARRTRSWPRSSHGWNNASRPFPASGRRFSIVTIIPGTCSSMRPETSGSSIGTGRSAMPASILPGRAH